MKSDRGVALLVVLLVAMVSPVVAASTEQPALLAGYGTDYMGLFIGSAR